MRPRRARTKPSPMSEITPAPLNWDVVYPHVLPVTVRPEDTDGMGHTNNVVYLGWLERVAWDHSHKLGMTLDRYKALDAGCVARRHELDYLAPTFVGEELRVGTWIMENDRRLTIRDLGRVEFNGRRRMTAFPEFVLQHEHRGVQ